LQVPRDPVRVRDDVFQAAWLNGQRDTGLQSNLVNVTAANRPRALHECDAIKIGRPAHQIAGDFGRYEGNAEVTGT